VGAYYALFLFRVNGAFLCIPITDWQQVSIPRIPQRPESAMDASERTADKQEKTRHRLLWGCFFIL
jgi:hypothetical protein